MGAAGGPAGHAGGLRSRKRKPALGSWEQDVPLVESFDLSTGGGPPALFPGDRGAHGWCWLHMEQAQGRSHRGFHRPHPRVTWTQRHSTFGGAVLLPFGGEALRTTPGV